MIDFKSLHTQLLKLLSGNRFEVSKKTSQQLVDYVLLLHKWNQIHNLTSIRNPLQMLSKHIMDSLAISPYLQGPHILDVGTGAGLPGLPLALTHPHYHFTLLDSNGKKTRFLTYILQTLMISNVDIISLRVEKYDVKKCFNSIVSRAFSQLNNFLHKTQHLCCKDGVFLAMKGRYPIEEINNLDNQFQLIDTPALRITGLDEKRHLLIIGFNRSL
ncbi:16S rRNA (guanine(527)-N(7))-methyltransferase [Rickettsiella grylli]|nr:16S rRNA (guanine(527)-N(7))-methyltransferase [Rickettsiella grylli]